MWPHILNDELQAGSPSEGITINGVGNIPGLLPTRQLTLTRAKEHRLLPVTILLQGKLEMVIF